MTKVLMVISGADAMTLRDGTSHPTGYWAEEVAVPHRRLREAGVEVDVATPGGTPPTADPLSLDSDMVDEAEAERHRRYLDSISSQLERPLALAEIDPSDYDAIVIPGGHGPMEDLAHDPDLGRILARADAAGQVIAPLCHGPAALLSATDGDGGLVFAGRRLTAFSDEEEHQGGLADASPWLLESSLRERGAQPEVGPAWKSHVVVDGNLISGQNPSSSADLAERVLTAIGA